MLTNSNTHLVRELYTPFALTEVNSKRAINCMAAKREGHTDLIIRNYPWLILVAFCYQYVSYISVTLVLLVWFKFSKMSRILKPVDLLNVYFIVCICKARTYSVISKTKLQHLVKNYLNYLYKMLFRH